MNILNIALVSLPNRGRADGLKEEKLLLRSGLVEVQSRSDAADRARAEGESNVQHEMGGRIAAEGTLQQLQHQLMQERYNLIRVIVNILNIALVSLPDRGRADGLKEEKLLLQSRLLEVQSRFDAADRARVEAESNVQHEMGGRIAAERNSQRLQRQVDNLRAARDGQQQQKYLGWYDILQSEVEIMSRKLGGGAFGGSQSCGNLLCVY